MLSERAKRISPSATFAMKAKAEALKAKGTKVYNFSTGEPDFPMPDESKRAVEQALKDNFTSYTAVSGVPAMKKAIVDKFKREDNLDCETSQVVVSCGAKHTLYNLFQVLLNPGDEVIVPSPYWVSYPEQIKLAEGNPVFVETARDFSLDIDAIAAKVSNKTKALLLNSPCNPTGNVIDKAGLEKIAELAIEKDFLVISDEVYQNFIYGNEKHYSIASFNDEIKEKTITVNAVSKAYAMTGLRIGYAAGPPEIIKAVASLQGHSTSNPNNLAQAAAIAALNGDQKSVAEMKAAFTRRREFVMKAMPEIEGLECPTPKGAFYVFPYVDNFYTGDVKNSFDFCDKLLEKAHASLVPGGAFGRDECVRLSYATADKDLQQGIEAIKKALENWK